MEAIDDNRPTWWKLRSPYDVCALSHASMVVVVGLFVERPPCHQHNVWWRITSTPSPSPPYRAAARPPLSLVCGLALFLLDFYSGGLVIHMCRCLISQCLLLGQMGVIALHFQLNPALIEI